MQAEATVCCAPLQAWHAAHALTFEPAVENVPGAQASIPASDNGVQGIMTRWPGPGIEQIWHVGSGELGLVAK